MRTLTIVSICCLLQVAACESKPKLEAETVIRPVRVERVESGTRARLRTFSGMAQAGTETQLSFQLGGTVVGFKLKVGDKLKKGTHVASLEATDQALAVQEAQAGVTQADAQRVNAQASYDRVRALYENNNATQAQLDAARASRDSATAAVAAAKKRLQLAQSQAGKTRLQAPVEGTVAKVLVESGENVRPGQPIAVVNSGSKTEVAFAVPESLIASVKQGQSATVEFDSVPGESFPADVTEVGVSPSGTAATYDVVAKLKTEDERIKSGMAAEVQLRFGDANKSDKLFVNPKAVGEDRAGRFAYVAVPTDPGFAKVVRRKLKVGEISAGGLEVLSGIKPGELIVTAGLTYLEDGKRVRLPKEFQGRQTSKPASDQARPVASAAAAAPSSSVEGRK